MRISGIHLVFIFVCTCFISPAQEKESLQTGIDLFNSGKFGESLTVFRNMLKSKPGDPKVNYYLGASFIELKQFSDSAFHALSYASQEEGFEKSFYYLGLLNHHSRAWNEAIKNYNKYRNQASKQDIAALGIDNLISGCYNRKDLPLIDLPILKADSTSAVVSAVKDTEAVKPDPATNKPVSNPAAGPGTQPNQNVWIETGTEIIKNDSLKIPDREIKITDPDSTQIVKVNHPTENKAVPPVDSAGISVTKVPDPSKESGQENKTKPATIPEVLVINKDSLLKRDNLPAEPLSNESINRPVITDTVRAVVVEKPVPGEPIEFQVSDDISYIRLTDFRTEQGKNLYLSGKKEKNRLDSLQNQLILLRKKYESSENPSEKEKTGNQIIDTEKEEMILNPKVTATLNEARQSENAWWSAKSREEIYAFKVQTDSIRKALNEKVSTPVALTIDSSLLVMPADNNRRITPVKKPKPKEEEAVTYKIQLGSWKGNPSVTFQNLIKKISLIRKIENYRDEKGYTVYTTGNLTSYSDAEEMLKQVKQEGVKNAQIIAFISGKKIPLQEGVNNPVQK